MLRGGRGILAAFAGIAALLVALATGAFFGALHAPRYGDQAARSAYERTQTEQHRPSQIDRDRAGLPYSAERIASGPDPSDGLEREKRDLAAQESMSVWAFWGLMVAAGGLIVTAIGTSFLLWQIVLTREAVKDTGDATQAMLRQNKIAERAQRPWLSIDVRNFELLMQLGGGVSVVAKVIVRNSGLSAANDVSVGLDLVDWYNSSQDFDDFSFLPTPGNGGHAIAPNRDHPFTCSGSTDALVKGRVWIQALAWVTYKVGDERARAAMVFEVAVNNATHFDFVEGGRALGGSVRLDLIRSDMT